VDKKWVFAEIGKEEVERREVSGGEIRKK